MFQLSGFETPFPSLMLQSIPGPKEQNPTLSGGDLFFENKNSLLLGGKGVVSVKDTGCGRQICSLWGGFCGFNIKLQKWPTKSRTGGFLHILDEVMEP